MYIYIYIMGVGCLQLSHQSGCWVYILGTQKRQIFLLDEAHSPWLSNFHATLLPKQLGISIFRGHLRILCPVMFVGL